MKQIEEAKENILSRIKIIKYVIDIKDNLVKQKMARIKHIMLDVIEEENQETLENLESSKPIAKEASPVPNSAENDSHIDLQLQVDKLITEIEAYKSRLKDEEKTLLILENKKKQL